MSTPVRTIVSFSDDKHKWSIPDLVLYINTDFNKLCFNKEGSIYFVETEEVPNPVTDEVEE